MHKNEVDLFFQRAKNFSLVAKERIKEEDWDLACFMAEQAVQLFLRARILELTGEMPRGHSIRKLITLLYNLTNDDNLKYNRNDLLLLESSYLNSRYIYNIYTREDAFNVMKNNGKNHGGSKSC